MERVVDLGRLDFVLHVDSVDKSQRFYELLGFQVVEIFEASAYGRRGRERDMVKSCVWRSGGVLSCDDFVGVLDSVLEGNPSHDMG